jgi:hypothetical protein
MRHRRHRSTRRHHRRHSVARREEGGLRISRSHFL